MKDKRYLSPSVKGMKTCIILFGLILVQLLLIQPGTAVSPSFFGWNQAHMPLNNTNDIAYGDYLFLYDNTQLYPSESVVARNWTVQNLSDGEIIFMVKNVTEPVFGPIYDTGSLMVNLTVTDGNLDDSNVSQILHVNDGRKWIQANYTYDLDSKALPYGTITFHDASIAKLFPEVKVTNWWWNVTNSSGYSYYSTADSITPGDLYPFNEQYLVNLTVNNSEQRNMASVSGILNVSEVSDGPSVWFDAVPRNGSAPLKVDFIDLSSGNRPFSNYNWYFGEGPLDQNASPTHIFTTPGFYSISLEVTDSLNRSRTITRPEFINVEQPSLPVVDFSASPVIGPAPLDVSFVSLSTGTDSTSMYNWTFGDESSAILAQKYVNHTYTTPGSYSVSLNVTNSAGFRSFIRPNMITVTDDLGGLSVTPVPRSGYAPLSVSFIVQSSGPNLTSYTWDFGDGSEPGTDYPMQHRYMNPGTYPVSLRVIDEYYHEATAGTTVTVSGSGDLVADFTAQPLLGSRPFTVAFNDTSAGNPDSWFWQFGDGYVETTQNANHTYNSAGTYPVSLTVKSVHLRKTAYKESLVSVTE